MRSDGEASAAGRPRARLERMIGRQIRLDRGRAAGACGSRISLIARGATDGCSRHRRRHGLEFARRGGEMFGCAAAGFGNSGFGCGGIATARRGGLRRPVAAPAALRLRRDRLGANRAQIAFDHRQPVDHMAERVVDGFERILGVAVGFRSG